MFWQTTNVFWGGPVFFFFFSVHIFCKPEEYVKFAELVGVIGGPDPQI